MTVIDEIKEKINIEDLVAEVSSVKLRKSGANYVGFCPFHTNTHTPSLVVFPGTGTWRCFGSCNEGGTVIDWVLKQNPSWDVSEAVHQLANKANIFIPKNETELTARIDQRAQEETLKVAMNIFKEWLFKDADALAYARGRGWTDETIKASGIGFSGRATAADFAYMRGEFSMRGIDPLSAQAVMILGFSGDVAAWAEKNNLNSQNLGDKYIAGMMGKPGLIYAHKSEGKIEYLTRRNLPGFDEIKSFNPVSELAGHRKPFFNHLHKSHYAEGKPKGERIMLVEGQADAVTWGQFGVPAMALCGSSWQYLVDIGIVDDLKNQYESISYGTDSDAPGEIVVTGKKNDFPLTTAFGPMLWVARMPRKSWKRPDGKMKSIKDTNDLAQWFFDRKINKKWQDIVVRGVISNAAPIVLLAAEYAGKQYGQFFSKVVRDVAMPLVMAMPIDERTHYSVKLAAAFYPNEAKGQQNTLYRKLLGEKFKELKENDKDDDDDEMPEIETLGGWYPDDATNNSGYLIDILFDKNKKKILLAWAHIKDMEKNEREVGVGDHLIIGKYRYMPPVWDDVIMDGVVKLASELGPLMSSRDLINKNADYYQKYFYLEEKSRYKFCGAYSLFSWVYDSFEALNFLRARGGSGSGKSDLMYLVGLTSFRFAVTLSTSSSASYRGLAKVYKASVMIDEADNLMKKDDGTMEAFLKGRSMRRYANSLNMMESMSNGVKTFVPSTTNVYGITFITMYNSFSDPGIENRCITFDLSQIDTFTLDKEGMEPGFYPPELEDDAQEIRNLCLRWRLETWRPKIELTPEQRKSVKLADPMVSPRVNQVLRPMKVLAVLQQDDQLLQELIITGRANYEDEMTKRSSSFEAIILRAVIAADTKPGYADKVKEGRLGKFGTVRHILFKDLAVIANEVLDSENLTEGQSDDKKKNGVKPRTIGEICRETFRMPVARTKDGWTVVLDRERIDIGKLRFGLDREEPAEDEETVASAPVANQAMWNEEKKDWQF